jgi:hypothetical protein
MNQRIPIIVKVVVYQFIFLAIHYLYDWFPHSLTYFLVQPLKVFFNT